MAYIDANTLTAAALIGTVISTAFSFLYQKRSEQLPYIKLLHDEMNDIIFSLYYVFNDPNWNGPGTNKQEENHKRLVENFQQGNRYYIITSIPLNYEDIAPRISTAGRKILYFNQLKKRYVQIFSVFKKITKGSHPLYEYFQITEYEQIYAAYRNMPDVTSVAQANKNI